MSISAPKPTTAGDRHARYLPPWTHGPLAEPPRPGWRLWIGLLGPGVVLAGTSIGSGEWLFGPAVSAQYGATLLWLASISIMLQVFCNLMMMRYTLYCGEPIIVGGLRVWPGPMSWIAFYVVLDIAAIWPYNASNAAVPLAAALLGHLPSEGREFVVAWMGDSVWSIQEPALVKALGYLIFVLAFVPLIFGGTVYRMLEKIMTLKLVLVLGYLSFVAVFMVSRHNAWEAVKGFVRFGDVPLKAETVVSDGHFTLLDRTDHDTLTVRGTIQRDNSRIVEITLLEAGKKRSFNPDTVPSGWRARYDKLIARATELAQPGRFFAEMDYGGGHIGAGGRIAKDGTWEAERFTVADSAKTITYDRLAEMPADSRIVLERIIENQGLIVESLPHYVLKTGQLPPLDWAMLAAFIAIAGAGGMSNTLFSNYSRDKGWGMGARVGAIPSAISGRTIALSHVGEIFDVDQPNLKRWRGWIRHIVRDQGIFIFCSFLGMALPCMLSLEFIRNATVSSHAVAGMTAEGMAKRVPEYAGFFWTATLLCGFLVLAPGQVSASDQIARRWTDIIWTASPWAKRFSGSQVRYVYYGILSLYAVWGLFALSLFNPLQIAKIGAVLGNVALGVTCLQAWYANRKLLPRELQPSWFLQVGALACGLFFLSITMVVVATL